MTRRPSRRSFLIETAGAAAVWPTAMASMGKAAEWPVAPADDETYWQMVRRQFAFKESKVPMNSANLCPSSRVVAERVTELTHDIDVDCSFQNRSKFGELNIDLYTY